MSEWKLLYKLKDDQYPFSEITHNREIVRAIVFNENGQIALTKLKATDAFGKRDYYELPGGGVEKGETLEEAVVREIKEEVGYNCQIVEPIGLVVDYYNLIKRENHNYFFVLKTLNYVGKNFQGRENQLIEKVVWVGIKEAIKLYKEMQDELCGILVKRRELPIIELIKGKY